MKRESLVVSHDSYRWLFRVNFTMQWSQEWGSSSGVWLMITRWDVIKKPWGRGRRLTSASAFTMKPLLLRLSQNSRKRTNFWSENVFIFSSFKWNFIHRSIKTSSQDLINNGQQTQSGADATDPSTRRRVRSTKSLKVSEGRPQPASNQDASKQRVRANHSTVRL